MATNVLRDNSTDLTLAELVKPIEQLDISGVDSSDHGSEPGHSTRQPVDATTWDSAYQAVAGNDKILAMFLLERDCRHMDPEEASLMLARQLSLLDPVDDIEIEQLVLDCYQQLSMGQLSCGGDDMD
ncbi:hypothetical protein FRC08_010459, partial [Ceratobasidium sp. 394]